MTRSGGAIAGGMLGMNMLFEAFEAVRSRKDLRDRISHANVWDVIVQLGLRRRVEDLCHEIIYTGRTERGTPYRAEVLIYTGTGKPQPDKVKFLLDGELFKFVYKEEGWSGFYSIQDDS